MNHAYWYDAVGNITTVRDDVTRQRENFTYDPLDRLVSAVPSPMTGVTTTLDYTETYSYTPIGNFISKAGVSQYYTSTKPHAVTSLSNGASFTYDANGNMTQRVELSGTQWVTYTQEWNVDNKLVAITSSLGYTATYAYDADGARVKRVDTSGTLLVIGTHFEVQASAGISTSYYFFGGQRVAMRTGGAVYWLHGDHLGSASLTTNITGAVVSEMRYYPFGETRWVSGTLPTDCTFTGQRADSYSNIIQMGARWYSALLGRFLSADSIVPRPGDSQAYNRYSYVQNNPLLYIDPTGHMRLCGIGCDDPEYQLVNGNMTYRMSTIQWFYVTFMGDWTNNDKEVIIADVKSIAGKVRDKIGAYTQHSYCQECGVEDELSQGDAFEMVFGHVTVQTNNSAASGYCMRMAGGFGCNSDVAGHIGDSAYAGITIHELGHTINALLGGKPYTALGNSTITDADGNHVTGLNANKVFERTDRGYRGTKQPYQQHPSWMAYGNTPGEDFADMFMSYVQGSFTSDSAGRARYAWMDQHMALWVKPQ